MPTEAPSAQPDQRLHHIGLTAYWQAVDAELAREVSTIEAAERAALAAVRAALVDAEAEHVALLGRLAYLDRAELSAISVGPKAVETPNALAAEDSQDGVDGDFPCAKAACAGERGAAASAVAAPDAAALPATAAISVTDEDTAVVHKNPSTPRLVAATGPAAATRRSVAFAALAERLAPVHAERVAAETALAAMLEANAALRARLGMATGTGTASAPA